VGSFSQASRAGATVSIGRTRAEAIAKRLGVGLLDSRHASRMRQKDVGTKARVSQTFISRLERGRGAQTSIETWAIVAAATGYQLAAFLEQAPGADPPRDHEHLRRQQLVIEQAATGRWKAQVEVAVDDAGPRSRAIDVVLLRPMSRELVAVEIWDLLTDVGAAMRSLEGKVAALDRRHTHGRDLTAPSWRVRGLWVIRATHRNRGLVREFGSVFSTRFPARSADWVRALTDPATPMPPDDGLLWSDISGSRLFARRG
jgi:transcriptional regulator with XRE-family HTH domain